MAIAPSQLMAYDSASTLQATASDGLPEWLQQQQLSLAFTTYQTNRLFCVGSAEGRIALHERLFDKPMGLFAKGSSLYMSTRYQIWQLDNLLTDGEVYKGCDRLYTPKLAHTTGDLNVHDVVLNSEGDILFVNTDFSCLARLSDTYSFEPVWQPPFINKLVAEDRCHLNGLAMRKGQPAFMTACSATNTAAGWRNHRTQGGVVLDVQSNEIIATGLSMPHSPRWYQGKLWLLNSGTGELGHIDLDTGTFIPLNFCPGFVRGLAFHGNIAFVGLSKLRSRSFTGLALEQRLIANNSEPQCGLLAIDITTGKVIHWLRLQGVVEELFDIVVLPGVCKPQSLGFQSDEIQRLVTFPNSAGVVTTKPTVKRPGLSVQVPVSGLPTTAQTASLKFQQVHNLTPTNLLDYESFTYPSLKQRWQSQPQSGELLGISASIQNEMVGFAIAECLPNSSAELISWFVSPAYRRQGIGSKLVSHLQKGTIMQENCTLKVPLFSK